MIEFKFGRGYPQLFGNIGLRQLREQRDETVRRWSELGLLDGLVGHTTHNNVASLFESQTSYLINEKNDIPFRFR